VCFREMPAYKAKIFLKEEKGFVASLEGIILALAFRMLVLFLASVIVYRLWQVLTNTGN